ncbi:MAG: cellulase family glycosylhydrolase [Spirochaetales bacterium]|nr:cellulase family glycosylhydrolase [Spirochaetales bacterium]
MKKKLFSAFIFLALSLLSVSLSAQSLGDVDHSGKVNVVDALLVAQYYVGLNPDNFDKALADVDCSLRVDIVDALFIAKVYVGIINGFPCTPENSSPLANYTFWPQAISTSDDVYFYGLASYSKGGTIVEYSWDFGDSQSASGANVKHQYSKTGNYIAVLSVTDNSGKMVSKAKTVSVSISSGQSSSDNSVFNFEDGSLQGFTTNNTHSTITNTTEKSFSGSHAIKWEIQATEAEMVEAKIDGTNFVSPGSKTIFRLWLPENAPIDNVQAYVMPHTADWSDYQWNANWQGYQWVQKGIWLELDLILPETSDPSWNQQIGFQLKTSSAGNFTLYFDSIDWPNTAKPPVAAFDYTPDKPEINSTVVFDAVDSLFPGFTSSDTDGSISSYTWDFGDSLTASGTKVSHSYSQAGKYPVTLTVTDNDGLISSLTRVVWVGQNLPPFAPPLRVQGTQILDSNGIPFVPKSVAVVDSLNYTIDDFKYLKKEWKIDAVRLPYITSRWYYNENKDTDREAYLKAFDNYLDWTYELGIYVLLDGWHEGGDTGNVDFHFENAKDGWHILMPRLKDQTHIIWEVYNEPYEISWENWVPKAEELIDIIMSYEPVVDIFAVAGVTWAQDFNVRSLQVNRPNVIYSVHPYPHVYNKLWNASAWDNGFGYIVNEGYAPVIVTEYSFNQDNADREGYGEAIIRYLEEKGIGSYTWIIGNWGGPVFKEPNSYRNDGWQFTWEYYNGIWKP